MKVIICTWRIREWELQILNWSSSAWSVQPEIVPLFTISFQCLKKKFKSWQVYDWLAKWLIMSGYMDLRRPRVYRRSNVGLVIATFQRNWSCWWCVCVGVGLGACWFHLVRLFVHLSICRWYRVRSVSSTMLTWFISYLPILSCSDMCRVLSLPLKFIYCAILFSSELSTLCSIWHLTLTPHPPPHPHPPTHPKKIMRTHAHPTHPCTQRGVSQNNL